MPGQAGGVFLANEQNKNDIRSIREEQKPFL
jgi:hypothetical protein